MKDDIYYNITGAHHFITVRWHPDPFGGPAIQETIICVAPGQGINVSSIGWSRSDPKLSTKDADVSEERVQMR